MWQALSKTLNTDDVSYLKEQFALLEPNKSSCITLESIRSVDFPLLIISLCWGNNSRLYNEMYLCSFCVEQALMKQATDAMKESQTPEYLASVVTQALVVCIHFHDSVLL